MPVLRRATAALGALATLTTVGVAAVVTTAGSAHAASAAVPYRSPAPAASSTFALRPGDALVSGAGHNTLGSQLLPGARDYVTSFAPFGLTLQDDGNLVEYETLPDNRKIVTWSTHTTTATRLVFQSDHNVVLRDAAGRALWSTGTAGTSATYFSVYGNGQLAVQDDAGRVAKLVGPAVTPAPGVLLAGSQSPSSEFVLLPQSDGNVVEYQRTAGGLRALWSTRTAGSGEIRLVAQSDGNVVVRQVSTGRAVWASGTRGTTGYYQLDVQDDANVVLYRTDGVHRLNAVWASHTRL